MLRRPKRFLSSANVSRLPLLENTTSLAQPSTATGGGDLDGQLVVAQLAVSNTTVEVFHSNRRSHSSFDPLLYSYPDHGSCDTSFDSGINVWGRLKGGR